MSTLKVNSIIPVAGVPTGGGGGIVQMKQTVKTDTFSTTSTSAVDVTGMSVTITPTSSSSKILITYNLRASCENIQMSFFLKRGSTTIYVGNGDGNRIQASSVIGGIVDPSSVNRTPQENVVFFIDSPATTSAVTYKIQTQVNQGDGYVNRSRNDSNDVFRARTASSITAIEVSA